MLLLKQMDLVILFQDDAKVIENPRENSSFERNFDYAIMMRTIYNMLSLDFAMQVRRIAGF